MCVFYKLVSLFVKSEKKAGYIEYSSVFVVYVGTYK